MLPTHFLVMVHLQNLQLMVLNQEDQNKMFFQLFKHSFNNLQASVSRQEPFLLFPMLIMQLDNQPILLNNKLIH